jgi:hypothetical protein
MTLISSWKWISYTWTYDAAKQAVLRCFLATEKPTGKAIFHITDFEWLIFHTFKHDMTVFFVLNQLPPENVINLAALFTLDKYPISTTIHLLHIIMQWNIYHIHYVQLRIVQLRIVQLRNRINHKRTYQIVFIFINHICTKLIIC